ncbi:hypothetical protein [Corynebacterium anserum]|uniref:Uncharacterized protein n=1 Tax=Corynebacterium anserum TaxID=2684406 RepID=A0A7G7YMP3_9CORY|nr:hypothetical protein [Corynebacterium anserum]MBC2681136.1 hypothetical protein [Corynebacterium anserum]QNH95763.1 hypothetical protein GP473_02890 [Corynebacterium anserum]
MFEWLINLPVWIQTPFLVIVALVACFALATLFHALLWRILPPTEEEKAIAGYGVDGSVIKKLMLVKATDEGSGDVGKNQAVTDGTPDHGEKKG